MLCLDASLLLQHLFTCDLDGKGLTSVADCVQRLRLLDGTGRVWGQSMQLELRGANLLLTDIETKVSSAWGPQTGGTMTLKSDGISLDQDGPTQAIEVHWIVQCYVTSHCVVMSCDFMLLPLQSTYLNSIEYHSYESIVFFVTSIFDSFRHINIKQIQKCQT